MAQILRAPFQTGMQLGMGFNSYTQATCLNRAVDIKRSVSSDKPAIPQQVTYIHKTVEKLNEISSGLNVSGSVTIKAGMLTGSGAGRYVDESRFSESDLNFLIQVDVKNQHPAVNPPEEQFNLLSNVTPGNFNSIYGDTYIYDVEEGGVFQAVVSMKIIDNSSKEDIEVQAKIAFSGISGGVDAEGKVESAKANLNKSTDSRIFAFWQGGGQVKQADARWGIDELIAVGSRFPELCSKTPSTSYVVLKKYIHLASFQQQVKQISPLSYEDAALHTDILLDDFLQYKQISRELSGIIEGIQKKTVEFDSSAGPPEAKPAFKASLAAEGGLLDAKEDLLSQTAAINTLVDEIVANPDIVKTLTPDKPPGYMDPIRWKLRLPATRAKLIPPAPRVLDPKIMLRGKPAVTTLPNGQHEVFAQGTEGFLWRKLTTPGSTAQDVEIWEYHGDNIPLNSSCSPVCATAGTPDHPRKFCFVVGADSKLYFKSLDGADGNWSTLQPFDVTEDVRFASGLAACARSDRVDLVALGVDAAVYWTSVKGSGTWTSLARLGGASIRGVPALGVNGADNSLNLFAIDLDSHLQVNILPTNSSAWSGWKANPNSTVIGDEISAAWPAHPDPNFKTQLDVMILGEPRSHVFEHQLLNGAWRDPVVEDFKKDGCRGPVAIVGMGPDHEEFFVVAEQGTLWQATFDLATGSAGSVGFRSVADGPFRPVLPVLVPLTGGELAVYLVNDDGKLVRLASSGGKFPGVERV